MHYWKTERARAEGGYRDENDLEYEISEGWAVFRSDAEATNGQPELIAVVGTETMADVLLEALNASLTPPAESVDKGKTILTVGEVRTLAQQLDGKPDAEGVPIEVEYEDVEFSEAFVRIESIGLLTDHPGVLQIGVSIVTGNSDEEEQ